MFKLKLIICQVVLSSARVLNFAGDRGFENDNEILMSEVPRISQTQLETWDDTLWVLKLNDSGLNFTFLRSATEEEEEYFDAVAGPMIHRHPLAYLSYKRRQESRRVKKDDPRKSYPFDEIFEGMTANSKEEKHNGSNDEVKYKIIQIINKFVLSFQSEPNSNLPETIHAYDTPILTLYFKGPFTTLMVNYERLVWQFFIKPPSPLPEWFYNEHSNIILDKHGMYAAIPDAVKEEFYEKLLHLLAKLFSFPI